MGAPKQKWAAEEEAALRAGVVKHGAGKWRTILKDPEFNGILVSRSNVDLKDKWRNISVTAYGWGSREKARLALKRSQQPAKHNGNPSAANTSINNPGDELVDVKPITVSTVMLDNIIMEAITNLKEPRGSNKSAIALYIEDQYWSPPNFKRLLSTKLKALTAIGKLTKVKRQYRIAPPSSSIVDQRNSVMLHPEGVQDGDHSRGDREDARLLTKSNIDSELAKMRNMNAQEAARAAAQAVAEAAMAEAAAAAREADAAEVDAEAAQSFAEAAMMALKNNPPLQECLFSVESGRTMGYCMGSNRRDVFLMSDQENWLQV